MYINYLSRCDPQWLFPGPILRPHPRLHVTCSTEKHRGRPTKFYSMSHARKDGKRICAASNGKPGEGLGTRLCTSIIKWTKIIMQVWIVDTRMAWEWGYQNATFLGQVSGSVHKLLASNNVHRNIIRNLLPLTLIAKLIFIIFSIHNVWIIIFKHYYGSTNLYHTNSWYLPA